MTIYCTKSQVLYLPQDPTLSSINSTVHEADLLQCGTPYCVLHTPYRGNIAHSTSPSQPVPHVINPTAHLTWFINQYSFHCFAFLVSFHMMR